MRHFSILKKTNVAALTATTEFIVIYSFSAILKKTITHKNMKTGTFIKKCSINMLNQTVLKILL